MRRLLAVMIIALIWIPLRGDTLVTANEVTQIHIKSSWSGLGNPAETEITIRNDRKSFRREQERIDPKRIETLVSTLEAAPLLKPDLANLGITEAWLKSVVRPVTKDLIWNEATPAQRQSFVSSFTDMETVSRVMPSLYSFGSIDDSPVVEASVILRDGSIIRLSSHSQYEFMLPWSVTRGSETTHTYNADISRALAGLMPEKSTNRSLIAGKGLARDLARDVQNYIGGH
jgi:hypothetical protein